MMTLAWEGAPQAHTRKEAKGMDGWADEISEQDLLFPRPFVRSFDPASERGWLDDGPSMVRCLPARIAATCLSLARSLPLSTLASVAFSLLLSASLLRRLLFGSWPECSSLLASGHGIGTRTDGRRTSRESGRRRPRKLVAASAVGNALLPISFNEFSYVESCAFISNEIISTSLAPDLSVGLLFFLPLQSSFISFPAH